MIFIQSQNSTEYHRDPIQYKLRSYGMQKYLFSEGFSRSFPALVHNRFLFVLQGQATLSLSKGKVVLKKYDSLFLPKHEKHELESKRETEILSIDFTFDGEYPFPPHEYFHLENAVELKELFLYAYELKRYGMRFDGVDEAVILLILNKIEMLKKGNPHQLSVYKKCCAWAEENAHKNASVEDLALAIGYTPEHLNRILRLYCNQNLRELLISHRIQKIKLLASEGNYTLPQLAKSLDFYSVELLRKFYRYHTGTNLTEILQK